MAPARKVAAFRLDDDLRDGLDAVWQREGIPPSEQVRRAIRAWLDAKGVITNPPVSRLTVPRKRKK
jgi:predicted DNA-binding protein